ncbi:hypothetical protein [Niallia sp. 01092]
MNVDAQVVINLLSKQIANMSVELAIKEAQIAELNKSKQAAE